MYQKFYRILAILWLVLAPLSLLAEGGVGKEKIGKGDLEEDFCENFKEEFSETLHEVMINGHSVAYKAVAGLPPMDAGRRAVVRRRQAAVLAAAALAFLVGIAFGAGAGDEDSAPDPAATPEPAPAERQRAARAAVDRLPLTRQVGRLVVLRFAGTSAPAYVREVLGKGRAAGAILFRDNLTGPEQTKALTAQLTRGDPPPAADLRRPGGRRDPHPPLAPARALGPAAGRAGTERTDAAAAARGLRDAGVNVSLAPVADVASVPGAALAGRAFSTDFEQAADSVAESVRGWQDGRVAATVKHFPGLGGATVNTDDGPATIARSAAELRAQDASRSARRSTPASRS